MDEPDDRLQCFEAEDRHRDRGNARDRGARDNPLRQAVLRRGTSGIARLAVNLVLLAAAALLPLQVTGQQGDEIPGLVRVEAGDYTVQASAVRTNRLQDDVLRRHGLPADDDLVLLNVTVLRDDTHVSAEIVARAINLMQQVETIDIEPTVANGLLAYAGIIEVAPREMLRFDIDVTPEGAGRAIHIEFEERVLPPVDE